jgi:hypothetical protein
MPNGNGVAKSDTSRRRSFTVPTVIEDRWNRFGDNPLKVISPLPLFMTAPPIALKAPPRPGGLLWRLLMAARVAGECDSRRGSLDWTVRANT